MKDKTLWELCEILREAVFPLMLEKLDRETSLEPEDKAKLMSQLLRVINQLRIFELMLGQTESE